MISDSWIRDGRGISGTEGHRVAMTGGNLLAAPIRC
jgi:hypothetical protein